ncbi:hypothetical protein [Paraburkholderia acidisoli]|uniref:Uncharacterized protein n=1 Tax=Paraburkholderia acidisoli TaxID=2571748 RepID=A0A7Z2GR01_9BURK|nr:hypothetical protein [Paraburkholderia acidisoli]QGZ66277.1 hypothetical protein FAZ98_31250 [Paraburkholderia acidisoli]QGZ66362.1 hypothetical protein FAZ98_31730 [Paraburkholderia acidisoli]
MKASFRITEEGRKALRDLPQPAPMTHAEEVKALMAKGMKIIFTRGHAVWAFAPKALSCWSPYSAAFPAAHDVSQYLALGGEIVTIS